MAVDGLWQDSITAVKEEDEQEDNRCNGRELDARTNLQESALCLRAIDLATYYSARHV